MKTIKIGRPYHAVQSNVIEKKIILASEIVVDGLAYNVYTADKFDLNNQFIVVNTEKCPQCSINTSHIVEVRPIKIVKTAYFSGNEVVFDYRKVYSQYEIELVDEYVNVDAFELKADYEAF